MDAEMQFGKMTVTGEGTVSVAPDTAQIDIAIEVRDGDTSKASSAVSRLLDRIRTALEEMKLDPAILKLRSFAVSPYYENFNEAGKITRRLAGYSARQEARIALPLSSDIYLSVFDSLTRKCPDHVSLSISYVVENSQDKEREALRIAAQDALESGKTLASALHVRILGIDSVSKDGGSYNPINQPRAVMLCEGRSANAAPQDLEITIPVTVVFRIVAE